MRPVLLAKGWSALDSGAFPDVLNVVTVPYVKNKICKNKYGNGDITKRMICAGNLKNGGVDSCQGDSGGPLTWKDTDTGRWKIAGVVSWGIGCGEKQYPGVYAEVEEVLEWIKSNSGEDCVTEPPTTGASTSTTTFDSGMCWNDEFINDSWCDMENNNAACDWDGGDCCSKGDQTADDWDWFCKPNCKCLDPNGSPVIVCKDEYKKKKCKNIKRKGNCNKWIGKNKCKKTCGHC